MPRYLPTEEFHKLAEAIAALEPCPMDGRVTANQIKIALGAFGDIWPMAIRPYDEDVVVRLVTKNESAIGRAHRRPPLKLRDVLGAVAGYDPEGEWDLDEFMAHITGKSKKT
jgi:hypothetical protein